MTQSTIYLVVGLVVSLVLGLLVAQRYRRDHPEERMTQWLDSHHMGWLHPHKH
jgi:Tfp pilus assembly protein PilX